MPTVINTNMASLLAQNSLSGAQNNLANSVQRLSSGLRINAAKDDAAGLAISQDMQSQINGVNQSIRNLTDATNLIQTADSSLGTIHDMLLRMKTLAVQGYNGSLSSQQRSNLVDELRQLNQEINNTSIRTKFNGNNLISSDISGATTLNVNGFTAVTAGITVATTYGELDGTYTFSAVGSTLTLTSDNGQVDTAIGLGAISSSSSQTFDFNDFGISVTISTGAGNGISAVAGITTAFSGKTITNTAQANEEYDFQAGPNYSALVTFNTIDTLTKGTRSNSTMTAVGTTLTQGASGALYNAQSNYLAGNTVAVDTWDTAFRNLSDYIDDAVNWISDKRSVFGAQINRISYVSENLRSYTTNLQSTRSQIIDTDFAAETARLTKGQIMQQAATAMLAQANQMPNVILSLLK
jgi:flagellin